MTTTVEQTNTDKQEALNIQSEIAQKLIKADGWAILREFFKITNEMLSTTQLFVLPVLAQGEVLRNTLGEQYAEFDAKFTELKDDIGTVAENILALSKQHLTRKGHVDETDLQLIQDLASAYSKIQTHISDNIGPAIYAQMAVLEERGLGTEFMFKAMEQIVQQEAA